MLGEILMYSTELTAAQVKTIEDYLLFKWVGIAPTGYGDFTDATVSGAGDVKAAAWDNLPQIAPTFTGRVFLTGDSLAFAFDPVLETPVTESNRSRRTRHFAAGRSDGDGRLRVQAERGVLQADRRHTGECGYALHAFDNRHGRRLDCQTAYRSGRRVAGYHSVGNPHSRPVIKGVRS